MGGSKPAFPETLWSSVLAAATPGAPEYRTALERLLKSYWKPVYAYIRASTGSSIEESKDLTQGFFLYVLEGDLVARYAPEKGRFRHFLKGVVRNFLSDAARARSALKRGGDRRILPLEDAERILATPGESPEEAFDRQWSADVFARALGELRRALLAEGRESVWQAYSAYELQSVTCAEVARSLGLTEEQVKERLRSARERLEKIVVQIISDTVSNPDERRDEMNELLT